MVHVANAPSNLNITPNKVPASAIPEANSRCISLMGNAKAAVLILRGMELTVHVCLGITPATTNVFLAGSFPTTTEANAFARQDISKPVTHSLACPALLTLPGLATPANVSQGFT